MKPKQYHQISSIISEQEPFLAALQQKASLLIKLKNILIKYLPEELHSHVRIKHIHQGMIELSVTTPAIATSIRHQAPSLLEKINAAFAEPIFYQLQCQVNPTMVTTKERAVERAKRTATPLSAHTKEKLAELSKKISYPALAEALKKLATSL